jgi:hypothetical protein
MSVQADEILNHRMIFHLMMIFRGGCLIGRIARWLREITISIGAGPG